MGNQIPKVDSAYGELHSALNQIRGTAYLVDTVHSEVSFLGMQRIFVFELEKACNIPPEN